MYVQMTSDLIFILILSTAGTTFFYLNSNVNH